MKEKDQFHALNSDHDSSTISSASFESSGANNIEILSTQNRFHGDRRYNMSDEETMLDDGTHARFVFSRINGSTQNLKLPRVLAR